MNTGKHINAESLFKRDLIDWRDILMLSTYAQNPPRTRAKGMECITGGLIKSKKNIDDIFWMPIKLGQDKYNLIKNCLPKLPPLQHPIDAIIANKFIYEFLPLANWPNWVPSFMTKRTLTRDQENRWEFYSDEKLWLEQEVEKRGIILIDDNRRTIRSLTGPAFFTNTQARKFFEQKGLEKQLEQMISGSPHESVFEIIRKPETFPQESSKIYFGIPQDILDNGIESYKTKYHLIKSNIIINNELIAAPPQNDDIKSSPEKSVPTKTELPLEKKDSSEQKKNDQPVECRTNTNEESKASSECNDDDIEFISAAELEKKINLGRSTIYAMTNIKDKRFDENFPRPVKIGMARKWIKAEIEEWQVNIKNNNKM